MEDITFIECRKDLLNYEFIKNKHPIENTEFGLLRNFVFYIDSKNSHENLLIEKNLGNLQKAFRKIGKTFIYLPSISVLDTSDKEILSFYQPEINLQDFNQISFSTFNILEYFGIQNTTSKGFLLTDDLLQEVIFYECLNTDDRVKLGEFIYDLIDFREEVQYLKPQFDDLDEIEEEEETPFNAPYDLIVNDDKIVVEDEIAEEIKEIINQLEVIKSKGQIISAIPIFEKLAISYGKNIIGTLSRLIVDEDYKIFLTDYNLEIKLSHLTKSIYFLFLLFPEGIKLENLIEYKEKLLDIYCSVSNKSDISSLKQNIDNLFEDKNAIYVHLSRIKSEFYRKMHSSIANKYIIKGDKGEPKSIEVNRALLNVSILEKRFSVK